MRNSYFYLSLSSAGNNSSIFFSFGLTKIIKTNTQFTQKMFGFIIIFRKKNCTPLAQQN